MSGEPSPARSEHGEMCAVVMTMRDGSRVEQVFATRLQAERFLYLLPYLLTTMPDGDDVASAILSPLVEVEV